jgi:hypothetical protein
MLDEPVPHRPRMLPFCGILRQGFRGDKYCATYSFKWNAGTSPGWVVRWLDPGNYLAVAVSATDSKARLYKRQGDGTLTTLATSTGTVSLSAGTWYTGKVVIDNDPNNASLQQPRTKAPSSRSARRTDRCPRT